MIINRKEGLPGYGTIGESGNIGNNGLSIYYVDLNLNDINDVYTLYNRILDSESDSESNIHYNDYDYILDNRSYMFFVKDILNTHGESLPSSLYSFNLNNYYINYLSNRIYSTNYIDNVYTNNYYVNGNCINYINYVNNKNLNHVIFNNFKLFRSIYEITPYILNICKVNNNYLINYISNIYDTNNKKYYNILSSNKFIFDNLAITYNNNKNMISTYNNCYPLISLCDYQVNNLLNNNFNIVNNLVDISNCLNISFDDTYIMVDWDVTKLFVNKSNADIINNYAFDLLVYTNPKSILTNNNITFDASSKLITCNNQYFKYNSTKFILKKYYDNKLNGSLKILYDTLDSSMLYSSIDYRFAINIKSKSINDINNYIEHSIYSNSIIKNISGQTYYLNLTNNLFNISYNEQELNIEVASNIPYNDEININAISNNDWIKINSITKIKDDTFNINCSISSNYLNGENTLSRNGSIFISSKNLNFSEYNTTCTISQTGYVDQSPMVNFEIVDNNGINTNIVSDPNLGLYNDMFAYYLSLPINNSNVATWKNKNVKYIELSLDLIIDIVKDNYERFTTLNKYEDCINNSFRIGIQYLGKNDSHGDYSNELIDVAANDNKIQDLFNNNGILKFIKQNYTQYLNIKEKTGDSSYNYVGADNQYNKYKWINFDASRGDSNSSVSNTSFSLNRDYFTDVSSGIFKCTLKTENDLSDVKTEVIRKTIIIPIEDGLTIDEYNDNVTLSNSVIKNYIKYSPKIRIFFQYENPSIARLNISWKRNYIKLLDASYNELIENNSKHVYNEDYTNSKTIHIIDWHPVLLGFNNKPSIQIGSNFISRYLHTSNNITNELTNFTLNNIRLESNVVPTDYKKYVYSYNKLPNVINKNSYIKYGFNSTSSNIYGIVNGEYVLMSKYKQVKNNYPIYGTLNYNSSVVGNSIPILNITTPSGLNNSYIPDNINKTWYDLITFATWNVPESLDNTYFRSHEMTTNRNIDVCFDSDTPVKILPEAETGLFMNVNYMIQPFLYIVQAITKFACPYNLYFNFKLSDGTSIINKESDIFVNMVGRPQVTLYTKSASYVFINANNNNSYFTNAPTANYNDASLMQTYNVMN